MTSLWHMKAYAAPVFLEMLKEEQKEQALSVIMKQYTDNPVSFQPEVVKRIALLQLTVKEITAKSNKIN